MAVGLLVWWTALPAEAYVRSQTRSGGQHLYWLEPEVVFHLDVDGSADIDDGSDLDAVRASFLTWNEVTCEGDFDLTTREGGMLTDPVVEHVPNGANANVVTWVEDRSAWNHSLAVIGVTSATYDARDGRILDADIEFNGVQFSYTTTGAPLSVRTDIQNTATHEIGHFLGLDHTPVEGATMEARAPEGETRKRTLSDDDIQGLCAVTPPAQGSVAGLDETDETAGWVCGRIAPGPSDARAGVGGALWLLGILAIGRWRTGSLRRRRRSR